jgi:diketogulonate reductase-like aldo/keto reductase
VAVENQLSPRSLGALPVLQQCEAQDIAVLSWSPLGGSARAADLGQELPEFAAVARERAVSPHQVALAWALHLSPVVLPLPAARRPETILDSVAAAPIQLTDDERSRLRAALTTSSEGRRSGASVSGSAGL